MVVIRLSRKGSRHSPKYRVTVADSRRSAKGRFIEAIGHYDPQIKTPVINAEKYQSWIAKGAQASRTVRDLYRRMLNPPDPAKTKAGGKDPARPKKPSGKPASGKPASGKPAPRSDATGRAPSGETRQADPAKSTARDAASEAASAKTSGGKTNSPGGGAKAGAQQGGSKKTGKSEKPKA